MSSFLVVSHKHELLPFANRLVTEGHKVYVVIWRQKYERAWSGRIDPVMKFSRDSITKKTWLPFIERVKRGELILISNVPKAREIFEGHGYVWLPLHNGCKDAFRWGGWFDGENISHEHLLVVDRGAWPGGLGASVDGGLTLVRAPGIPKVLKEAADAVRQELTPTGYKGLFAVEFEPIVGTLRVKQVYTGYLPLHVHAFFAEVPLSKLLSGQLDAALPRFSVALPLSLPPWPVADAHYPLDLPVKGLTAVQMGRVWWHDVQFDLEEKQLRTAGLDGLLGVCVGSAHNLELARGRVLEVAKRLDVPELQYRPDVATAVPVVVSGIEESLGLQL